MILSLGLVLMVRISSEVYANPLSLNGLPSDFLSLGAGKTMQQQQQIAPTLAHPDPSSDALRKIMSDDYSGEFAFTEAAVEYLEHTLTDFARREHLDDHVVNGGHAASWWLAREASNNGRSSVRSGNGALDRVASELDYMFANFWTQFKPLLHRIVTERPANLENTDRAFRCQRYDEIKKLKEFQSVSPVFGMLVDTFSIELYNHCLVRKLAMIKLNNVQPLSIVRQFVDIYLDLPTRYAVQQNNPSMMEMNKPRDSSDAQLLAGSALRFNLQNAISAHGPLESAAGLIFDPRALGYSLDKNSAAKELVAQFKQGCHQHIEQLGKIWSDFDHVAKFLSSPMINLADFNSRIKFVVPRLVYGSICAQLIQTAAN